MKTANAALVSLLNSGSDFQMADLWTITLANGTVVRWSGADVPILANGNTYALGPIIERSAISEKVGVEVATLDMTIMANADDLIAGVALIPFIVARGLDGASIKLERAFLTDWNLPVIGTIIRFAGRVTSVPPFGGSTVALTVSAWTILMNVSMPAHLYQSACVHNVYDAGCTLNPATFSSVGTVQAGVVGPPDTRPTQVAWLSNLTGVPDRFTLGRLTFTSGANAGLKRSIRTNVTDGTFEIINPLPVKPAAGDTFTAYWGCDRTSPTCSGKFNNLANFKGTEFVPTPETSL
jgi:uncharacterized phage protein (TIGR02218 family)